MARRWAILVAGALAVGCQGRTELMVGVITELRAPDVIDEVRIDVNRDGVPVALPKSDWPISAGKTATFVLPGSYGLYSTDGSAPKVEVTLTGLKGGQKVVERKSLVTLVSRKTLFMRMGMVVGCMGRFDCRQGTTCIEGQCQDELVDERTLPEFTPDLVDHVTCQSGESFINTSDGTAVPPLPGADASCPGACVEGTCYLPPPDDGGAPTMKRQWIPQVIPASASTQAVRGIWGSASGGYDVFAVGDNGLILHLSGGAGMGASGWSDESLPGGGPTLFGVSGTSASDVWAVGSDGVIVHRTANGWQKAAPLPSLAGGELRGVVAVTPMDATAAGGSADGRGVVWRWDGTRWSQDPTFPASPALRGVQIVRGGRVVVGLARAAFVESNPGQWKTIDPIPQAAGDFSALWFAPPMDAFVVGDGSSVVHIASMPSSASVTAEGTGLPRLEGVWASAGNDVYAVGAGGAILHSSGAGEWSPQLSGTTEVLHAIFGMSPTDLFAVGERGAVLHSSGGLGGPIVAPADFGVIPTAMPDLMPPVDMATGVSYVDLTIDGQNVHIDCTRLDRDFTAPGMMITPGQDPFLGGTSASTGLFFGVKVPDNVGPYQNGSVAGSYALIDGTNAFDSFFDPLLVMKVNFPTSTNRYHSDDGGPNGSTFHKVSLLQLPSPAGSVTYRISGQFQGPFTKVPSAGPDGGTSQVVGIGSWSLLVTYPAAPLDGGVTD